MTRVKLNEVRESFKSAQFNSFGLCLSTIYAAIKNAEEEAKEGYRSVNATAEELALCKRVLPNSKKEAKEYAKEAFEYLKIGEAMKTKDGDTRKRKDGTIMTYRWTVDGVLRFFTMKYNEAIPEAKIEKPKTIKHECATRKTKECKDENKKTANTMK